MTEIKHKLWDIGKIALGATVGYFFRAYRDKEEYKRVRMGIFKGSALIFATYMTFNNIVPGCKETTIQYLNGNQRIEEKKLDHEFQRDTMKIRREVSANDVRKDIQSSIDQKIEPLYKSQQDIVKKIDPLYSTQREVEQKVESIYSAQKQNKQSLEQVATKLNRLEQEVKTPKTVYVTVPTPVTPHMPQESTQSNAYRLAIAKGTANSSIDMKLGASVTPNVSYYEVTLDKSDGEAILAAVLSDNSTQIIGRYAASQPRNKTPDGTYQSYKIMRLSNDRQPGYIFFNENNPNCGISGAGPNGIHNDEITQRLIANVNGWRVRNSEFETIYAKASTNRLIVRVQE